MDRPTIARMQHTCKAYAKNKVDCVIFLEEAAAEKLLKRLCIAAPCAYSYMVCSAHRALEHGAPCVSVSQDTVPITPVHYCYTLVACSSLRTEERESAAVAMDVMLVAACTQRRECVVDTDVRC